MAVKIRLRKIAGWEFFDQNTDACDAADMAEFEALSETDRQVPEFFINALSGCRRVLDVGCGGGYPGLYVAPHVGELVGLDAAPNMIELALRNAKRLGATNASFEVGSADGLPYEDKQFDGITLCGLLESMDWDSVHRMMPEVRRVLAPGCRMAALDQDWRDFLSKNPLKVTHIRLRKARLMLRVVERRLSPHTERDTRYFIRADGSLGRKLLSELGDRDVMPMTMTPNDLEPDDVLDAEYDEAAQFDADSFVGLFASYGFGDIRCESVQVPAWGQKILFLTAVKPTGVMQPA